MYSVEMIIDKQSEEKVLQLWKGLDEAGISSKMVQIEGMKPHVTLSVYNDIKDLHAFQAKFGAFFTGRPYLEIAVDAIGCFPTSGTLYLAPAVTAELLEFHRQFHVAFSEYSGSVVPYYLPNRWQPHCTLDTGLSTNELKDAFDFCLQTFQPMKLGCEGVSLQRLEFQGQQFVKRTEVMKIELR